MGEYIFLTELHSCSHTLILVAGAHTFYNFQAKRRYVITREEANEYERRTEAARLQAAALQAVAAASQYNPSYDFGYPPIQQWP